MVEIDYQKLHKDGVLGSFIESLRELTVHQQETIDKYKDRKILAPIIKNLQKKVERWQTMIETAEAFQKKFRTSSSS